jgi:hypothetical protein
MIRSGYPLPFTVWYSDGQLARGGPIRLSFRAEAPGDLEALVSVGRTFAALAQSGALAAPNLPPWSAHFETTSEIVVRDDAVMIDVQRCRIPDESVVTLTHMLLKAHHTIPLQTVEILDGAQGARQKLRAGTNLHSTYPKVFPEMPFAIRDLQPETLSYTFNIDLQAPVDERNEQRLNAACQAWMRAILAGAYALAPIDPGSGYVEPIEDVVTAYGKTIEWAVLKLRGADPVAAIDGLLNIFGAFHVGCQSIAQLEIA